MRFTVLHQSERRIRIKTPKLNMSYDQADALEYYLKSKAEIKDVSVDERTGNATIIFYQRNVDKKGLLVKYLASYDENSQEVAALVPEETGRRINREYQEKLVFKLLKRGFMKTVVPVPIRMVRTVTRGIPYVCRALRTLPSGRMKIELLDGIAIAASVFRKDYSTASSIMFLLETGELLEEWTKKKSIGDLARTMSLKVEKVWVVSEQGEVRMPVSMVKHGDFIVVRTSEVIPLDGRVHSGEMTVNQASMTGEAEPVLKREGAYVYAGTVVEEGECIIEVTKEYGNGKYDQIVQMIEESEKLKSKTEEKAYRLADSLVPYSFLGFGLTYAITRNITKALSFLMVDYSCAMKLSMPLAVLAAIKEAREYGISIKGGKFMELVAESDTIVFDKTGTLTHANPKLVKIVTFGNNNEEEMLRIAACLEEHYPHSIANAIVEAALEKKLSHDEIHTKVQYIVAHGVSSFIEDKKAVIGSYHFVMEDEKCIIPNGEDGKLDEIGEEYSKIYLAIDGVLTAVLCIFDPVREDAKSVINTLHELGFVNICMMTGDNKKTAENVAKTLNIDTFYAEVLPQDKAMYVKKMREAGHKVIMVGDGVNDSPALSEADIGIAIDSGAAIAKEVADITIDSGNLESIITLRRISVALMNRIKNNYRFIVGFNTSLIAGGVTGVLSPSASALLHNGSTIFTGASSTTCLLQDNTVM